MRRTRTIGDHPDMEVIRTFDGQDVSMPNTGTHSFDTFQSTPDIPEEFAFEGKVCRNMIDTTRNKKPERKTYLRVNSQLVVKLPDQTR